MPVVAVAGGGGVLSWLRQVAWVWAAVAVLMAWALHTDDVPMAQLGGMGADAMCRAQVGGLGSGSPLALLVLCACVRGACPDMALAF